MRQNGLVSSAISTTTRSAMTLGWVVLDKGELCRF